MADIGVSTNGYVTTVELQRSPNNFLDVGWISDLAAIYERLDDDPNCRAIVLAAAGKHFCAGANLARRLDPNAPAEAPGRHLYHEAHRLVRTKKPVVAAVHGAAVGAGLGLALVADFRVGCEDARFSANFARQGYHPGFGTTCTLPRIVGAQKAAWLLYTGERIDGREALAIGLVDKLVPHGGGQERGAGDGRRDRGLGAAGGAGDPCDAASRARSRVRRGDPPRVLRADLAARHG